MDEQDNRSSDNWDKCLRDIKQLEEDKLHWDWLHLTFLRMLNTKTYLNQYAALKIVQKYHSHGTLLHKIMKCKTKEEKVLFLHNQFPYIISPWQSESWCRATLPEFDDKDYILLEYIPEEWLGPDYVEKEDHDAGDADQV